MIGGRKGWLYESIFARVQELGLSDQVLFPGFIEDADLPALYSGAAFFAYPSLYEGFGLPLIEALACGTPVLTGNNSCLPEAGGPGAIYVQAEDVDSIAEGIIRLATDEALAATTGCRRAETRCAIHLGTQCTAVIVRLSQAVVGLFNPAVQSASRYADTARPRGTAKGLV